MGSMLPALRRRPPSRTCPGVRMGLGELFLASCAGGRAHRAWGLDWPIAGLGHILHGTQGAGGG